MAPFDGRYKIMFALSPFTRYSQIKFNAKSLTLKTKVKVKDEKNGTCATGMEMFDSINVIFQNFSYLGTYIYTSLDTHTHTHTHTHAHTHTHTHTHTVVDVGLAKCEICNAIQICLKISTGL